MRSTALFATLPVRSTALVATLPVRFTAALATLPVRLTAVFATFHNVDQIPPRKVCGVPGAVVGVTDVTAAEAAAVDLLIRFPIVDTIHLRNLSKKSS